MFSYVKSVKCLVVCVISVEYLVLLVHAVVHVYLNECFTVGA